MVKRSKFHTEGPQIFGGTLQISSSGWAGAWDLDTLW
jgi:hypothetical protein